MMVMIPAFALSLAFAAFAQTTAAPTAIPDAGDDAATDAAPSSSPAASATASAIPAPARNLTNEDLNKMADSLLDNGDLVQMATRLLDDPKPKAVTDGGATVVIDDAGNHLLVAIDDAGNKTIEIIDDAGNRMVLVLDDAGNPIVQDGGGFVTAPEDAGFAPDGAPVTPAAIAAAANQIADSGLPPDASPELVEELKQQESDEKAAKEVGPVATAIFGKRGIGGGHSSAGPLQNKAIAESPFAKLGVPAQAVPAVATAATTGVMLIWPAILKTLTGLLKGFAGAWLKSREKKKQKINTNVYALDFAGFKLRPSELGSLLIAALVYGLAVSYTFQGWKMKVPFLMSQETLVVVIYFSRSIVRFVYERAFKLTTQYKFWIGGGLLCLGSAYMGNTLGTVGFELESTKGKEDADRIVKMKAWLIALALAMAIGFYFGNAHHPAKIMQSGRTMMSGMALGEVLPITPMPGKKIFEWSKKVWFILFFTVVPIFFLINFIL